MNERMKKAEFLFSEISGIDDAIVAEALSYRAKRGVMTRRAIVVLVAAALMLAALLGSFVIGSLADRDKKDEAKPVDRVTLEESLADAETSGRVMTYQSADDIDLFDGVTRIVWSEGAEYYAIGLSNSSDRSRLDGALRDNYSKPNNVSGGDEYQVKVWISYGDGSVVTPYLKDSAGNVGYGELFDYEAEIVPSESLAELVSDLVS